MHRHPSVLRLVGLCGCLAVASTSACHTQATEPTALSAPSPESGLGLEAKPAALLASSTKELRAQLDARYRLGPDRRLVRAISDVYALVSGEPWKETSSRWLDDRFVLEREGVEIGRLSELADFSEGYALLTGLARQQLEKGHLRLEHGGPVTEIPRAPPKVPRARLRRAPKARAASGDDEPFLSQHEALAAVNRVEKAWSQGRRSMADLHAVALALASLSFQALDTMEVADRLTARALAVVALARAAGDPVPTRAEVLIALALQYELAAARLAKALPPDDSLRAFLQQDEEALRKKGLEPTASTTVKYLWWRWVADSQVDPNSQEGETTDLPALANHLRGHGFHDELQAALLVAILAQAEAATDAGDAAVEGKLRALRSARTHGARMAEYRRLALTKKDAPGLFARFDASLDALPDGILLHRAGRQDYYLALLCSALEVMGRNPLDTRAMPELTASLVTGLDAASTPRAVELKRSLDIVAQSRSGRATDALLDELDTMKALGAPPRARVLDELIKVAAWGDPLLPPLIRHLVRGLDARPRNRLRLGDATLLGLHDLRLADHFFRAGLETMRSPSHEIRQAGLTGDWASLHRLAKAPHLTALVRAQAVDTLLEHHQLGRDDAARRLRGLLDPKGNDWVLCRHLVELLEADGRYAEARSILIEWIGRKRPEGPERIAAQTALARQYWLDGDLERAWSSVAPVVEGWQFDTIRVAARILAARGKASEAEEMGRRLTARYPGAKSSAVLCEVYWKEGRNADPVALLSTASRMIRLSDWGLIGESFATAFAGRPDADALAAFEALQRTTIDALSLSQLGASVARAGRHRLAFEILSRLKDPGPGRFDLVVAAYLQLKQASDEATARAWLATAVPTGMREPLAMVAMKTHAYELLWTLVPTPDRHDDTANLVWLTRATASLDASLLSDADRAALRKHFEHTQDGHFHVLGRYVLGLENETAALRLVGTDATKACEVAFYLGKRAESERHLEEAADWYRAAVDTGLASNDEYRWAADRLSAWYATGKSLPRLTAELAKERGG